MWLHVIGRLKPGVTMAQAKASVNLAHKQVVAEEFSAMPPGDGIFKQSIDLHPAASGVSSLRGDFAEPLYVLMGIVALVLLIACANVANLLAARAAARAKEIGVRLALGANRARITRQLLIESLLLAFAGGALGVLFAFEGVRLLITMAQSGSAPLDLDVSPDLRVLAFTTVVALSTGIIFGLAPAWRASRIDVNSSLKETSRGATRGASRIQFGRVLVTAQIALFAHAVDRRRMVCPDSSQPPERRPRLLEGPYSDGSDRCQRCWLCRPAPRRAVSRALRPPFHDSGRPRRNLFGERSVQRFRIGGSNRSRRLRPKKEGDGDARFDYVGPNFFSTLGIPLLLGREINERDGEGSPRICVVNESFAKFYFGDASPIGKHVKDLFPDTQVSLEIVGVVRDSRDHNLRGVIPRRFSYRCSALWPR